MAVTFLRLRNNIRLIYPWWSMLQTLRLKSKNMDSIESFISDLTQRKVNSFNQLRRENQEISRNQSLDENVNVEQNDFVEEIYNCLDSRDTEELQRLIDVWMAKHGNIAPRSVLIEVLQYSALVGNSEIFHKITSYVKTNDADFYVNSQSLFECLNLELDWKVGQNVDMLIDRFEMIYKNSLSDETALKHVTRFYSMMILQAVETKGESVVIKLRDRIESMCEESKNYQLLFELWRSLFESFWFSDQQLASQLIVKHAPLRRVVSRQLSFLCFIYLRNNNTELVNRLIQIFLQFNMTKQVETLVKILFDFECWRRNMDAVLQIVQLCLKLDIPLTDKENAKFLDLLLKRPTNAATQKKKITIPKYQFKF